MLDRPAEEPIRVRYGETDAMGHAYYAAYLLWFEQARGAWCRDRGFTYRQMEAMGFYLPVVEVHARFRGQVLYDDLIVVRAWVSEVRRAVVRFEYAVVNQDTSRLCTEGYTRHALVDKALRTVSIPPELLEMWRREPSAALRARADAWRQV
jgi:acyl-CoA thioester hydrolase